MTTYDFDAIVIGSGISGGWAAKELTEKGMKIVAPSPKLMADMRQVGGIMLADWQKKAGADGEAILAAYNKSKK